jgi:hypothetical protein
MSVFKTFVLGFAASVTTVAVASAADLPSRKSAPLAPAAGPACYEKEGVPTDVFGFTTGSDVNDKGALSGSAVYGGAYGTRFGKLHSHTGTLQLSYGAFECAEIGPYIFGNRTDAKILGFSSDTSAYGGGVEMKYKLLGRDVHGVGLTLVLDPSVARNDPSGFGNGNFNVYNTGLRMFLDKTLVPGKLYGAINVSHDMTWTGDGSYFRSSTFTVGAALSYQVVDGFYLGAEARHQRRYADLGFGNEAGYATFVGPNFYWQATKALGITAAYNIQVAGKAKGVTGDLDLVNFNQHNLKVKAAYSF